MLAEQILYYRARAGRYDEVYTTHAAAWVPAEIMVGRTMPIKGAVLDLACGTGHWTEIIAARPDVMSVTAVDASPEMIKIARGRAPDATFTCADIFKWRPDRQYDTVFMGFWLSRVPPARWKSFWEMLRGERGVSAARPAELDGPAPGVGATGGPCTSPRLLATTMRGGGEHGGGTWEGPGRVCRAPPLLFLDHFFAI